MSAGIIYYDWVPFFKAIGKVIYEFADDLENREQLLFEKARATFEAENAMFRYNRIDPFTFFYELAKRNTAYQKTITYTRAKEAFAVEADIPTDWTFPTPNPQIKAFFYYHGHYIDRTENEVGNQCLWDLFKQAYNGDSLNDEDFKNVLSLKNVRFNKLSQTLFLINPEKYMPFETQFNSLPLKSLENLKPMVLEIETRGVSVYNTILNELFSKFKGCKAYEINLFNMLTSTSKENRITISNKVCQISSWAEGQNDDDYYDDFVERNSVWTGGSGGRTGAVQYPLTNYDKGDIVLIRRGTKWLGGIGVIIENGYIPNGYNANDEIKIIWLVKEDRKIDGTALGQWDGFSNATSNTIGKFKELYPETFSIIEEIKRKQRVMIDHSLNTYKNIILQGPPGTGKTRMAKQIAEWLTDETEKSELLIEAIDKNVFNTDPNIEYNPQVKLIQFHPSYTYEDFVRGIKAETNDDNKLEYKVENRILATFAEEASKEENANKAFVLIIDEINRANLTSVLGELIYALEYRDKPVSSMYKYGVSHDITLPKNLYIIGTMNTADRSVSNMDYAIRRRFTFVPVLPSENAIQFPKAKKLFNDITTLFEEHTSPEFEKNDIAIGHSYFLFDDEKIRMKLKYEIKPLLYEYVKDGVLLETAREQIGTLNV